MSSGEASPVIGTDPDVTSGIDDDERPSEAMVRAVAGLRDEDPIDLAPLFETVDPDALDALVDGSPGGLELRMRYEGCGVAVTREKVRARLLDDAGR
jgi:hypothetical protein